MLTFGSEWSCNSVISIILKYNDMKFPFFTVRLMETEIFVECPIILLLEGEEGH